MKVVVLGAGVVGVATAYYLSKAGHEVEVVDRQPAAALETSYANAGEISPGYASPWAGPGIPLKALKWMLMRHPPLILRPTLDPRMLRWLFQILRNCTQARYAVNKSRMVRLAGYSRELLAGLRAETEISYDERMLGTLQLFRSAAQLEGANKDIDVLRRLGVDFELLDRRGCVAAEPGLANSSADIAGGLRLPADETGDCHLFTTRLAALLAGRGVRFRFDTQVLGFERAGRRIDAVHTQAGPLRADAFVLALGSFSPIFAAKLGMSLPIYPVKGYSITLQIADPARAPVSTLLDETYKIAITRLGNRIRVGGMAEVSGYNPSLPLRRQETLLKCVGEHFPSSFATGRYDFWSGMRPMTPDGTPIVGRTGSSNLFINSGHGTLGWTMACGSGKLIADLLDGRPTDIESADLGPSRYDRFHG